MGSAYSQPGSAQPGVDATAGSRVLNAGRPGNRESSSLTSQGKPFSNTTGYKSVPARPDPVAAVKSFLRASESPGALTTRMPYSTGPLLSVMPVDLPSPSAAIASTLGDPTDIETAVRPVPSPESLAVASPPTVGFSANAYSPTNAYSAADVTQATASYSPASFASTTAQITNAPTTNPIPVPTGAVTNTATSEDGLPVLEPIEPVDILLRPSAASLANLLQGSSVGVTDSETSL